jgi:hypothetical protein
MAMISNASYAITTVKMLSQSAKKESIDLVLGFFLLYLIILSQ